MNKKEIRKLRKRSRQLAEETNKLATNVLAADGPEGIQSATWEHLHGAARDLHDAADCLAYALWCEDGLTSESGRDKDRP